MITREALYDELDKIIVDHTNMFERWKDNDLNFREMAYFIWAAKELKGYVDKNPGVDLYIVVSLFTKKMCEYSCMGSSDVSKHMFSVGEALGNYILDCVLLK